MGSLPSQGEAALRAHRAHSQSQFSGCSVFLLPAPLFVRSFNRIFLHNLQIRPSTSFAAEITHLICAATLDNCSRPDGGRPHVLGTICFSYSSVLCR